MSDIEHLFSCPHCSEVSDEGVMCDYFGERVEIGECEGCVASEIEDEA